MLKYPVDKHKFTRDHLTIFLNHKIRIDDLGQITHLMTGITRLPYRIYLSTLLLIFSVAENSVNGQSHQYHCEVFNESNGLPDNKIYDIAFDKTGLMWISTRKGIYTFDNNTFKKVEQIPSNLKYLQLEFDTNGKLWLISEILDFSAPPEEKIYIYHPTEGTIKPISSNSPLPANNNFRIWSDQDNNIYIYAGESYELYRYNGKILECTGIDSKSTSKFHDLKTSDAFGYITWDTKKGHTAYIQHVDGHLIDSISCRNIQMAMTHQDSILLIYQHGKINGKPSSILINRNSDTLYYSPSRNPYPVNYVNAERHMYLADRENLIEYDIKSHTLIDLRTHVRELTEHTFILDLYYHNKSIWLRTTDGLYKIIRKTALFRKALDEEHYSTRNILPYKADSILVASENGIYSICLKTGEKKGYLTGSNVYSISPIDSTRYLLGRFSNQIQIWDKAKPNHIEIIDPQYDRVYPKSQKKIIIHNYVDDAQNIWVAQHKDIFRYNIESNTLIATDNTVIQRDEYTQICPNPVENHKLFLPNINGLHYLNKDNNSIDKYELFDGIATVNIQQDLYEKNIFWISSKYSGIYRWEYESDHYTQYEENDGLSDNSTHAAFKDANNSLWISTNNGISVLDSAGQISVINEKHGIHENEFNRHSYLRHSDSLFIFGGLNGITIFNPNTTIVPESEPIQILGYQYNNRKNDKQVLDTDYNKIRVQKHHDNTKIILKEVFPELSQTIKYINSATQSEWSYAQNNEILIDQLIEGENTFLISRQVGTNSWSTPISVLVIRPTPLYKNPHFILGISLLTFLTILYVLQKQRKKELEKLDEVEAIVKEKTKDLKEKNESLEKANELNNDLFTIIGHDLRSPISGLAQTTRSFEYLVNNGSKEDLIQLSNSLDKSALKLLSTVDKMIKWSQDKRQSNITREVIDIESLLNDVIESFEATITDKKVSVILSIEKHAQKINTDYGSLRSILRNVISNAIKYSPKNSIVDIAVFKNENRHQIVITDQGRGIDDQTLDKIKNKEALSPTSNKSAEGGLGIGLIYSIKLLENIGGRISFGSNNPKGTKVTITL